MHEHPSFDATDDRVGLVAGEVGSEAVAQEAEHALHLTGGPGRLFAAAVRPHASSAQEELRHRAGDIGHRQHLIGESRGHDAARHPVELCLGGVLHQHEPPLGFQLTRTAGAVAAGAGQHHADGELPHGLRE